MSMRWRRSAGVAIAALAGLLLAAAPLAARQATWVGAFGCSPGQVFDVPPGAPFPQAITAQGTLRYRLPLSAAGGRLRLRLVNAVSPEPLLIGGVSVALAAEGTAARAASVKRVTFGGRAEVRIPGGAAVLSDTVDLAVPPGAVLVASVYFPEATRQPQAGNSLLATLVAGRDATLEAAPADAQKVGARTPVAAIEVETAAPARTIVTLGDSITDGAAATSTEVRGWPGRLAGRLAGAGGRLRYAVSNQGISGNRLLRDRAGTNALARFDRDALSVPGVSHLIVLEGINDIGNSATRLFGTDNPPVRAEELIAAYQQLIARAHARGVRIYGGTLLPFAGAMYYAPEKEALRQEVNHWIRSAGAFDAVIDFDAAVRDPQDPSRIAPAFDPGDHLHPNDAGYRAMGDAIDLALFEGATRR